MNSKGLQFVDHCIASLLLTHNFTSHRSLGGENICPFIKTNCFCPITLSPSLTLIFHYFIERIPEYKTRNKKLPFFFFNLSKTSGSETTERQIMKTFLLLAVSTDIFQYTICSRGIKPQL